MLLTALALSMSLSVGMQKAQADVTVSNWNDLRAAIQNATGIITLDDAIEPGVFANRDNVEVGASNLTIDGQNNGLTGTILGLNPAQHIILNSDRTLNITNLTQSQYERFLYNNNGTVNISGSSFSNNDTSTISDRKRAGAAIYNAGGIINISEDSSFSGNQAYNGGAIANAGGTVVVQQVAMVELLIHGAEPPPLLTVLLLTITQMIILTTMPTQEVIIAIQRKLVEL